jgi:hypothetical protein
MTFSILLVEFDTIIERKTQDSSPILNSLSLPSLLYLAFSLLFRSATISEEALEKCNHCSSVDIASFFC